MSMHLEGPWLTITGKKKGKRKFRNADEARKQRELAESWQQLLKDHGIAETKKHKPKIITLPTDPGPYRRETAYIPSLPFTGGACVKPAQKVYTGTKIKGIGTLHKSNAVPVFSNEEAVEIAKMRR
jgi:hypothetical protein